MWLLCYVLDVNHSPCQCC